MRATTQRTPLLSLSSGGGFANPFKPAYSVLSLATRASFGSALRIQIPTPHPGNCSEQLTLLPRTVLIEGRSPLRPLGCSRYSARGSFCLRFAVSLRTLYDFTPSRESAPMDATHTEFPLAGRARDGVAELARSRAIWIIAPSCVNSQLDEPLA